MEGQNASFSVIAKSTLAMTYQWQVFTNSESTWSNINGKTSSVLTLPNVKAAMNNNKYRVIVTNSAGSVTSSTVSLSLSSIPVIPVITTQPTSRIVTEGQNTSFSVIANGTSELKYQWQVCTNGGIGLFININGETSSVLTLTNIKAT